MSKPFVRTYTGTKITFEDPDYKEIELPGMAMALARVQRFNGHLIENWSVADHSILMSYMGEPNDARMAMALLLHDGHEFATGDIPSPLKSVIRKHTNILHDVELKLNQAISTALGNMPMQYINLTPEQDEEIKRLDRGIGWLEANVLLDGFVEEEWKEFDTLKEDEIGRAAKLLAALLSDNEEIGKVEGKDPAIWTREKFMRRFYRLRQRLILPQSIAPPAQDVDLGDFNEDDFTL